MQKKLLYILLFVLLFVAGYYVSKGNDSALCEVKRSQIVLGTVVEIQARDEDKEKAEAAISKAFDEIRRIDYLFSSHNENSQVWKLNHSKSITRELPEELFNLIAFSDSIWKISNGAFDASLGNLVELWGFSSENPIVPDSKKINEALTFSGWKNIQLGKKNILGYNKSVKFDFGALAKGYAVDKAVETMKHSGIDAALVNAGGEVKGFGHDWMVGIQHPRNKNEIIGRLKLNDISVATSGDYEQYFEKDGKRYHHILNPKTGMPADGCQSVTIICRENKLADALATAVFVLGREKGLQLVEKLNEVEAMIIDSNGNTTTSENFNKFLIGR